MPSPSSAETSPPARMSTGSGACVDWMRNTAVYAPSAKKAGVPRADGPRHLSPEEPGRPHGQGQEQDAERHRERPRGTGERGHQALGHAEDDGGDERSADAAHPAQHGDGE